MAYQIGDETKELTKRSPYNFKCLNDDDWDMCSVKFMAKGIGLILTECKRRNCAYLLSIWTARICRCPTKYELYKQHNI
jgi:hypothetical protein